jgi:hypothetical protein
MLSRTPLLLVLGCLSPVTVFAQETAKVVVAAQIRSQGYVCDKPRAATPLPQRSRPDEEAWLLQCKNATYQVRLIPHKAAVVKIITNCR